jgi:hypothetical protein
MVNPFPEGRHQSVARSRVGPQITGNVELVFGEQNAENERSHSPDAFALLSLCAAYRASWRLRLA